MNRLRKRYWKIKFKDEAQEHRKERKEENDDNSVGEILRQQSEA